MAKLFNKTRKKLVAEEPSTERTSNYLKYAIGEVVLVVVGILIAISINNWNDARKERAKEVHYLKNIKTDLALNIAEMNKYIARRKGYIDAANRILRHFEGEPVTDYNAFNADEISIYGWAKFWQSDNTFQELVNSGNLALISNDSIKNGLLNLESIYKKMKSSEQHFRFDTEELLYKPIYKLMDLRKLIDNLAYNASNGQAGRDIKLNKDTFEDFFKSKEIKNGFTMTVLEFDNMNKQMKNMVELSNDLTLMIHKEINK